MPLYYPQCFVEVYPIDGGQYFINGGQIIACSVKKALKEPGGTFSILLAPGGPYGANSGPTWEDIITPMSFVLIGMTHGTRQQVVMLGLVSTVTEKEAWLTGRPTSRVITIEGMDFSKFFLMENWLAVTLLGGYAATAVGSLLSGGGGTEAGLAAMSPALLHGSPDQIVQSWYNMVMTKVMSKTYIMYKGQKIYFPQFMGTWFEAYNDANITLAEYYLPAESVWIDKFRDVMTFPWFEVFVVTAPQGIYSGASGGQSFTMAGLQGAASTPYLICRVNPLPYVPGQASGNTATLEGSINTSRWSSLPNFQADSSYIDTEINFNDSLVKNYFAIIPSFFMQLNGDSNNPNVSPLMYRTTAMADLGSIVRYGYRPVIINTHWFADPTGATAQQNAQNGGQDNIYEVFANLVSKLAGYYEPTPLMGNIGAQFPLLPDVMVGCTFTFSPGKGEPLWMGYVEAVEHEFVFGGRSMTTLLLSRCLPAAIYQNSGLLTAIHNGNAVRIDGNWTQQAGVPQGLGFFNIDNPGLLAAYTGANTAWRTAQQK